MNGWIFAELLVVSCFLWTVIDPIYVLVANYNIDSGYDAGNRYVVELRAYSESDTGYNKAFASDSLSKEAYWRIARIIRNQPEVESYSISTTWSFPNSDSWSGAQLSPDTASIGNDGSGYIHLQWYEFVQSEGSNMFGTYGMKDAHTGGEIVLPEDCSGRIFVSEYLARRLFGTTDVEGKKVYEDKKSSVEIAGVFRDFKHHDYEQPYPLAVYAKRDMEGSGYMNWHYNFILKLKDGVSADAFESRFRNEVAPLLSIGNFYFEKLNTFSALSQNYAAKSGRTNKLRLQYALAGFAILCIFLGMVGTFWIRCDARRQEIGVMRSMGASRATICRQFLVEAGMLVTFAFLLAVPLLLHYAYVHGVYVVAGSGSPVPNPDYLQNHFGGHFSIVLLLSYVLLLLIALVGTFIPAQRAARVLPADALRDE